MQHKKRVSARPPDRYTPLPLCPSAHYGSLWKNMWCHSVFTLFNGRETEMEGCIWPWADTYCTLTHTAHPVRKMGRIKVVVILSSFLLSFHPRPATSIPLSSVSAVSLPLLPPSLWIVFHSFDPPLLDSTCLSFHSPPLSLPSSLSTYQLTCAGKKKKTLFACRLCSMQMRLISFCLTKQSSHLPSLPLFLHSSLFRLFYSPHPCGSLYSLQQWQENQIF